MSETQDTVSRWADETFGSGGSNASVAARANIEMAELIMALTNDDNDPKAIAEVADIVIVLYRLVARANTDLAAEIDKKMAVNRARTWRLDGHGHGYHVEPAELPPAPVGEAEARVAEKTFDAVNGITVSYHELYDEYIGVSTKFPSLSWCAYTEEEALDGIRRAVDGVLADLAREDSRNVLFTTAPDKESR